MNRRDFIKNTAVLAAAQATAGTAFANTNQAAPSADESNTEVSKPLIDTPPVLQNYAETSMGISFGVTAMANGYVIFGRQSDLSDGQKVYCGGYRVTAMNDEVMQVRLTNLQPNTRYYYRIGADRIHYGGGYDMKILGNEEDPTIYSFQTAGADAAAHFCVINDTHKQWPAFGAVIQKVMDLQPSCVIWNGDACNTEEKVEWQKQIFLRPEIKHRDYAARIPYLFAPGNHDNRGLANRQLQRVWMFRQPEERSSRDWDLGRNFAVRMGDIAMIGLDTAEDKLDTNPLFCNLFASASYRRAQTDWLRDALQQPEIKNAPFLVTFCHIPLYDSRPEVNPGDVAPADTDPRYTRNYASWQRTCFQLWGPLLNEAGCQLLMCGHQHYYRYEAPNDQHTWGELIGGGPIMEPADTPHFPTVFDGQIADGKLVVRAYNVLKNEQCGEFTFTPRKIKHSRKSKK